MSAEELITSQNFKLFGLSKESKPSTFYGKTSLLAVLLISGAAAVIFVMKKVEQSTLKKEKKSVKKTSKAS